MFNVSETIADAQFLAACKCVGGVLLVGAVEVTIDGDSAVEAVPHIVTSEREFLTRCLAYYRANQGVEVDASVIDELLSEKRKK